ncbi:MAG: MBL fold metallo-hydrolase, partial [Actinomycetota bacterium]|nr:MBL fold metallo-hydrolase [Actinomycetota bacterium]
MTHHTHDDEVKVHKIEVGDMENNVYLLECPHTHEALLVDASFETDKILAVADGVKIVGIL